MAHIKLLLDQLALFHASSHRVLTGAEGLEQFKREFPTMNCQTWQPMTGSKMDGVMQQLIVDVYGIVKVSFAWKTLTKYLSTSEHENLQFLCSSETSIDN